MYKIIKAINRLVINNGRGTERTKTEKEVLTKRGKTKKNHTNEREKP